MIAIIVNGIELDITEDTRTSLTITVGLSEAGDVLKRAPEFAPSVTIPATAKNNAIFGYLNENAIKTGNVWLPVEIYDYPDLILKGNIQVNSFNGESYNCSCFSSQLDVITILKDTKLKELDGWDSLNHIYDNTPISQRVAPTQELLYLRADNGLYRNSSALAMAPIDLKPSISLQAVIDRMNDTLPFTTDIAVVPDETTTMLVNGKVIKYDEEYVKTNLTNTAELNSGSGVNEYDVDFVFTINTVSNFYDVPGTHAVLADADSTTVNNIYYESPYIIVADTQKVKINLAYAIRLEFTSEVPSPAVGTVINYGARCTPRIRVKNFTTGATVYEIIKPIVSVDSAANTAFISENFTDEFELILPNGFYVIDVFFDSLRAFVAQNFTGSVSAYDLDWNIKINLNASFEQQFATFEGDSLIPRGGLMRAVNILPDLTCFDVVQHLLYLYGLTLNITRDSLGTATGIALVNYGGKQALPLVCNIDFSNLTTQNYGVQSFLESNIVKYKVDEADPTTNAGALTTFICQHTIPNQTRDWYISPFAYTNTAGTFTNQLQIASIPNYVLPFGNRYIVGGTADTLLQVNDYFASAWLLYKVLVNCTVATLFDSPDNYEIAAYSDLGERDIVDRFVRVINLPQTTINLTDGVFSPIVQELKYNSVAVNQNKDRLGNYLTAIQRNKQVEADAYLTLSEFQYLSSQIFSGNRFTIPELGCDCYLQKIENYSPAVFGKCKLTFLTT